MPITNIQSLPPSTATNTAQSDRMHRSAERLNNLRNLKGRDAMEKVANEYAGQFVHIMMKQIQPKFDTKMIGFGGAGEEIFQEMINEDVARESAANDPYGLGAIVREAIMRKNGATQSPEPLKHATDLDRYRSNPNPAPTTGLEQDVTG